MYVLTVYKLVSFTLCYHYTIIFSSSWNCFKSTAWGLHPWVPWHCGATVATRCISRCTRRQQWESSPRCCLSWPGGHSQASQNMGCQWYCQKSLWTHTQVSLSHAILGLLSFCRVVLDQLKGEKQYLEISLISNVIVHETIKK